MLKSETAFSTSSSSELAAEAIVQMSVTTAPRASSIYDMGKSWVSVDAPPDRRIGGQNFVTMVRAADTDGRYTLMHWVLPAGASAINHRHDEYEETFLVLEGEIEFAIDGDPVTAREGMWLRAPAGVPHTYANSSGKEARMLVTFTPGGIEELFEEFADPAGSTASPSRLEASIEEYTEKARELHHTEYGV